MMVNIGPMSIAGRQLSSGGVRVDICRSDDVLLCAYFTLDPDNGSAAVKVFKMVKGNTGDGWLLFGRAEPAVEGEACVHDEGGAWELRRTSALKPTEDEQRVIEQCQRKAREMLDGAYKQVTDTRGPLGAA